MAYGRVLATALVPVETKTLSNSASPGHGVFVLVIHTLGKPEVHLAARAHNVPYYDSRRLESRPDAAGKRILGLGSWGKNAS